MKPITADTAAQSRLILECPSASGGTVRVHEHLWKPGQIAINGLSQLNRWAPPSLDRDGAR